MTTSIANLDGHLSLMEAALNAVVPTDVPTSFIPLVKIFAGLLYKWRKKDMNKFVGKLVIFFGAIHGLKIILSFLKPHIVPNITSSITMKADSNTGESILKWFVREGASGAAKRHTRFEDDKKTSSLNGSWIFYKGRPVYLTQTEQKAAPSPYEDYNGNRGDKKELKITTLGSSWVLNEIVNEAAAFDKKVQKVETDVRVVYYRDNGGYCQWLYKPRMTRSIETIEMEPSVKTDLINDITDFLSDSRRKHYLACGIPYKRGYLIFGPPGTGKSSFAYACAGLTDKTLYRANLGQIAGDGDMSSLFRSPSKGDILLLEDIDSAGVSRESMKDAKQDKKGSVTLSGLLNAIDDLNEGVVLMMTSNSPESLDRALIRPGRVDRQIFMGNVTSVIAESMFKRFYYDAAVNTKGMKVADLAKVFAAKLPEGKITPAELQGFLLQRTPDAAIKELDNWALDIIKAKEAGKNIVGIKADDADLDIKKDA